MASQPQRLKHCLNCQRGLPNLEAYCPDCGQKNVDPKQPFWKFLLNFVSEKTQINSKLVKTFGAFLLKPGFLTLEYWRGRRVSYLKPVRLFLILGVTAFLLVNWALEAHPEGRDFIKFSVSENDLSKADTAWERAILENMYQAKEKPKAFISRVLERIPITLLVLLPLFAGLLRLFYRKKSHYLVEHLAFLLHLHAFVFLEISLLALLSLVNLYDQYLAFLAMGIAWLFSLLSAKRVYDENWAKTLLKFGLLSVFYCFSMPALTFLISIFVSLFR